jgi:hypothetical protein
LVSSADPPRTNGFQGGVARAADLAVGDRIERVTFVHIRFGLAPETGYALSVRVVSG